jgi:hypothetical protein
VVIRPIVPLLLVNQTTPQGGVVMVTAAEVLGLVGTTDWLQLKAFRLTDGIFHS